MRTEVQSDGTRLAGEKVLPEEEQALGKLAAAGHGHDLEVGHCELSCLLGGSDGNDGRMMVSRVDVDFRKGEKEREAFFACHRN